MAEIPTSFGGLVFMMAAVSYLAGVVILLARPVSDLLQDRFQQEATSIVALVLSSLGALLLTVACVALPLKAGIRKVRALQL